MSDLDVVDRARVAAGLESIKIREYWCPGGTKPMHMWRAVGPDAVRIMKQILPYMGQRRSDKMWSIIADWYEYQFRLCVVCGIEFNLRGRPRSTQVCSETCFLDRRRSQARAAKSASKQRRLGYSG